MPKWYVSAAWHLALGLAGKRILEERRVVVEGRESIPREPFLLLANHAHRHDPWVVGAAVGRPVAFMANLGGVGRASAALARLAGAYAKDKGRPDLGAVRTTIRLAESGESIGLFPEGDRSWDGRTTPVRRGVAALAKRLGLPVLVARQAGSYLSLPRWSDEPRAGRWRVSLSTIGADALAGMSVEEVQALVARSLGVDDEAEASRDRAEFSCRAPASGAGRLLWRCPTCRSIDSIEGSGAEVRCVACGSRWTIDANLRVRRSNEAASWADPRPDTLAGWNDWQSRSAAELLRQSVSVVFRDRAYLERRFPDGPGPRERGTLSLEEGCVIARPDGGKARVFPLGRITSFVDNFNRFCVLSVPGESWRIRLDSGAALKWIQAIEASRAAAGAAGFPRAAGVGGRCQDARIPASSRAGAA